MARSRTNDEQVGRVIRTAREAAGMSIDEFAVDVKRLTGLRRGVSREAMRRLEDGLAPVDNVSPTIMAAVCFLLGLDLAKLAPQHAADLNRLEAFLDKRREQAKVLPGDCKSPEGPTQNGPEFVYGTTNKAA